MSSVTALGELWVGVDAYPGSIADGKLGSGMYVGPADGKPIPTTAVDQYAATLARFKVPEHVILVDADELPLTSSGNVRKFLLARRARQELLPQSSDAPGL